jgi:glycosyltransferase 2 family protein
MSLGNMPLSKILNRLILLVGIGVAVHVIIVLSTTESESLTVLTRLSIWHLLGIFICMIIPWFGTAGRIWIWARFLGEKIQYSECVRVVIVSEVISAVSPTLVGGTPIRAAMLHNRGFKASSIGFVLTYSIVEDLLFYFTGIIVAIFMGGSAIIQVGDSLANILTKYGLWIASAIILLSIILMINRRMNPKNQESKTSWRSKISATLQDMWRHFRSVIKTGKVNAVLSLLVLFSQWAAKLTILVILFDAFVMMLVVPTPGASGGAEASFLLMFGNSIPSDIMFLVVSVWRLFTYYFILLIAVAFYLILTYVLGYKENEIEHQ